MIFDLHTHTTIKPYHNKDGAGNFPNPDHWHELTFNSPINQYYDKIIARVDGDFLHRNQAYLEAYSKGNGRIICFALYPIEHHFTKPRKVVTNLMQNLINQFNQPFLVPEYVISTLIGIDVQKYYAIHKRGYDYFKDLDSETDNLINFCKSNHQVTILKDFQAFNNSLINIILTVEGVHSFISLDFIKSEQDKLNISKRSIFKKYIKDITAQTKENIKKFRKQHDLFFITFAHNYYNLFCGHAPSVPAILYEQGNSHFTEDISNHGIELIEELLSKEYGRILIDTKHMSTQSRIEYHQLVKAKRLQGDHIPIIQSHTAVSGRASMVAGKDYPYSPGENEPVDEKSIATLVPSSLNLFDDEIIDIIESDGLIGIMVDEKRIIGDKFPTWTLPAQYTYHKGNRMITDEVNNKSTFKTAKKCLHKRLLYTKHGILSSNINLIHIKADIDSITTAIKPVVLSAFLNQIFYIVSLYYNYAVEDKHKGWDHVCLGTDFDGVINSLDAYPNASALTSFKDDLIKYWSGNPHINKLTIMGGKNPQYYVEKIMFKNGEHFTRKYFNSAYRKNTVPVIV